jgi:SAM-dependent methyltransferase
VHFVGECIVQNDLVFEEQQYLADNPDVAKAVRDGLARSGRDHFWNYGLKEVRRGVALETYVQAHSLRGFTFRNFDPPAYLMKRVHGSPDASSYNAVGRRVGTEVFGRLMRLDRFGKAPIKICDFGCGPGRVLRHLYELVVDTGQNLTDFGFSGTDIDPEPITWAQRFLHQIGDFSVNASDPPLSFGAESFDFIYSISVFTHLPEEMQIAWIKEMHRIAKVGATLVLTTHGDTLLDGDARSNLADKGFVYVVGSGTAGLPEFYQIAYHSHKYIRDVWGKFFEIEKIISRGIAGRQDMVVCRRVR